VFSIFTGDAFKESTGDWELQFNNLIKDFLAIRYALEMQGSVQVFPTHDSVR
jgi:hypothetical protein